MKKLIFGVFGGLIVQAILLASTAHAVTPDTTLRPEWTAESVAMLWRKQLSEADYEQVMATYALISELEDESGEISETACVARADDLLKALNTNPVSLALHAKAADCALMRKNEADAEYHTNAFAALARHAVANASPQNGNYSIAVMGELDAIAFVEASGHQHLYSYYEPLAKGRKLPLFVALWDEEAAIERLYEFDYLEAQLQLRRAEKFSQFPVFRRVFAKSIIDIYGQTPDSIASGALAVRKALEQAELSARMRSTEQLARQGDYGAVMVYAFVCLSTRYADCGAKSIDILLPWAEERVAGALIAMAIFHSHGIGVKRDEKAARELLDLADRRLGEGKGTAAFIAAQQIVFADGLDAFSRKRLASVAKTGSLLAQTQLAGVETVRGKGKPLSKNTRAGLERAATAGIATAQHLLGALLIEEKKRERGIRMIESAALSGHLPAQKSLAEHYDSGDYEQRNPEQAQRWRIEAANGGDVESMKWLANRYASREETAENRALQEGWWQSAAYSGDVDASLLLAELDIAGGEGASGSPARGEAILREVLEKHDRPDARRALASLLVDGAEGVKKDPVHARQLLQVDADDGDAIAQAVLGAYMLGGKFGKVEPEGAQWVEKALANDDPQTLLELGSVYYYENIIPRDKKLAIQLWERAAAKDLRMAQNNLAWAWCTVDDESLLNAQRGLGMAKRLVGDGDGTPPAFLDTLAACHAASGQFEQAIEQQMAALKQVEVMVLADDVVLKHMRERAEQYRKNERYTEYGKPK